MTMLANTTATDATAAATPASHAYSASQVSRLLDVPEWTLRYWSRTDFMTPSIHHGARSYYSFHDILTLKVATALLKAGMPLQRIRTSLEALARDLPGRELSSLRVRCEGDAVVVEDAGHRYEPATGQLVLDFEVASLEREAAAVIALPLVEAHEPVLETAYDWFVHACDLEDEWGGAPADTLGFEAAKQAYERALALDPKLAAAWTNLGSMLAERGDRSAAREHYQRAIAADPEQPEAHCNLAELSLREGRIDDALEAYRRVVHLAPDWGEGHYGLARALLRVGGRAQALAHLERFISASVSAAIGVSHDALAERLERARSLASRLRVELESE